MTRCLIPATSFPASSASYTTRPQASRTLSTSAPGLYAPVPSAARFLGAPRAAGRAHMSARTYAPLRRRASRGSPRGGATAEPHRRGGRRRGRGALSATRSRAAEGVGRRCRIACVRSSPARLRVCVRAGCRWPRGGYGSGWAADCSLRPRFRIYSLRRPARGLNQSAAAGARFARARDEIPAAAYAEICALRG